MFLRQLLPSISVLTTSQCRYLDPLNYDPTQPSTFTQSTSLTVFDSLGESHVVTAYYVKTADNNWASYYNTTDDTGANLPLNIAGGTAGAGGQLYNTLTYDNSGGLASNAPDPITTQRLIMAMVLLQRGLFRLFMLVMIPLSFLRRLQLILLNKMVFQLAV